MRFLVAVGVAAVAIGFVAAVDRGLSVAVVYGVYLAAAGGQPVAALALLLFGGVVLASAFRRVDGPASRRSDASIAAPFILSRRQFGMHTAAAAPTGWSA